VLIVGNELLPKSMKEQEELIKNVSESHHQTGVFGATFLLTATILGAGILTIPYQFYLVGIVPTSILLIFVALINWYSVWMMIEAGDESGATTYEDLAEKTVPRFGKYINTLFISILLFGALTAYMDIIASLLDGVFSQLGRYWYTDKYVLLLLFSAFFMFPLCMLRNISKLEYSSFVAVVLIAFFTGVIGVWGIMEISQGKVQWNSTYVGFPSGGIEGHPSILKSLFQVLPTITLAYGCQPNVFSIRNELENNNRKRTNYVNIITNGLCFFLYYIMGFFGYLCYPHQLPYEGNIINAIPHNVFGTVLRSLFIIAILFHFPCVHFAVRNTIEVTFFQQFGFSWIRHTCMTIFLMCGSMFVAIQIPSLSNVFSLTGSLAAFPVSFIIPALAYIRLVIYASPEEALFNVSSPININSHKERTGNYSVFPNWLRVIPPVGVILFSLVAQGIGLYSSILAFVPTPRNTTMIE
jgi:amino acid permease